MIIARLKRIWSAAENNALKGTMKKHSLPLYMSTPLALSLTISDPSSLLDFKSLASNLYTSFIKISFSPFKKGDYIRTQGYEGTVQDMNFMYLKLLKKDKGYVFIPTSSVYKNIIEVFNK